RFTALVVRERFADALHVKALALPVRWHEQHHSGDTLHRMSRATTSLASFAQSQFIYLQNTVSVVGPIAALFLISRATGVAAMVGYAAIGFFVVRIDAFMVRLVREENRAERRYHSALVDCLANIATVVTLRLQEPMRRMLRSRVLEVFAPLRRNIVFNEVKWGGIDLLNSGMRTGLVALYAWLDFRQHGTISVGTAVVVHQYSQQVGNVVASMAMHWNDLVRQKTEVGDVDPIFASPARSVDNAAVPRTWRDIRVEGVRYVHPAAGVGRPALDDVSMELRRGQRGRVERGGDLRWGDERVRRRVHRVVGPPAAPAAPIRHRDGDGARAGRRQWRARRSETAPARPLCPFRDGSGRRDARRLISA